MPVDIGLEAILRGSSGYGNGATVINRGNPASIAGTITSIDIRAEVNLTNFRVGTFYTTNGNTLKCRASSPNLGTIVSGSKVTKVVSIAVEIGDYIGCYSSAGSHSLDTDVDGLWFAWSENIDPDDETVYNLQATFGMSLGGYIPSVGWIGKISGVTNPAKIMGVDVANIYSVKGVVSG